jgi:cell division protein FtsI (penicillin-binding protein 3)
MIKQSDFAKRVRYLLVMMVFFFGLYGVRLVYVQVIHAHSYATRANDEMISQSVLLAPRGTITDINGVVLARSDAAKTIVVDQTMISDPAKTAQITAPALGIPVAQLQALLTGKRRYQIIANPVTPAVWDNVQSAINSYNASVEKTAAGYAQRIVGFFAENTYTREYPTGSMVSSLIGFTHPDGTGASGLEASLNSELSGVNGAYDYAYGAGTIIPGSQQFTTAAKPGTSIKLTIDRDVQWAAQSAITAAVKSAKALSGTVIVINPKNGQIVAQASAPTFDPSKPKTITLNSIRNPAVQDVYEPGSTGKVITVSAALEEGTTTPTTLYTIPNRLKAGGRVFQDDTNHPTEHLTTAGILAVSSNIGAIQIGASMPNQTFYNYLQKFGIGQSTGSNLGGESDGILHPVAQWSNSSAPTMSFGQGYSVTPMQATMVFATIANNGVRVTPNVIAGTYDANGNYTPSKPGTSTQVVSADTASKIRMMLEGVVSEAGTAPEAEIPGYQIAGKTGTAMRVDPICHCYRGYTASFIGMAPASDPQYVVSVVIENPQGAHFGGVIAAPVFKKVMSFVLQEKGIAPAPSTTTAYPLNAAQLAKMGSTPAATPAGLKKVAKP